MYLMSSRETSYWNPRNVIKSAAKKLSAVCGISLKFIFIARMYKCCSNLASQYNKSIQVASAGSLKNYKS